MKRNIVSVFFSVVLSVAFVAVSVYAATTIGTNIDTGGTLAVTGLSTFINASSTQLTTTNRAYLATTGGSVGIGTTSPTTLLSVHGNSLISGTSFFGGAITATSTLNLTGLGTFVNASSTQLTTTNSAYFATTGGSVGIGTTSPYAKLSVAGQTVAEYFTATSTTAVSSFQQFLANASTTLQNFTFLTATGTSATTTNSFATTASSTNLFTSNLTLGTTAIAKIHFGTCTVTIGSVTASSTAIATCAAMGVTTAFKVFVTPYITNPQIIFSSASSTADDVIQIAVYNTGATSGALDPADNVWSWMAIR